MGMESTSFSEESLTSEVAPTLGLPLTSRSPRPSVLLSIPSWMGLPNPAWLVAGRRHHDRSVLSCLQSDHLQLCFPSCPFGSGGGNKVPETSIQKTN